MQQTSCPWVFQGIPGPEKIHEPSTNSRSTPVDRKLSQVSEALASYSNPKLHQRNLLMRRIRGSNLMERSTLFPRLTLSSLIQTPFSLLPRLEIPDIPSTQYLWNTIISFLQIQKSKNCLWCLHAVSSRQNPAAGDENTSTEGSIWHLGVLWSLLQRDLPGYRPWTDLQPPVDSGQSPSRLRLATGLKLWRCVGTSGDSGGFWGCGDNLWNLGDIGWLCDGLGGLRWRCGSGWRLCGSWVRTSGNNFNWHLLKHRKKKCQSCFVDQILKVVCSFRADLLVRDTWSRHSNPKTIVCLFWRSTRVLVLRLGFYVVNKLG